jgi:hypothetical protein
MHTTKIKIQSSGCKNGNQVQQGQVSASHTKQMVLALIVYTNYMPRGAIGNADYIVGVLMKFLKALCQKRPDLVSWGVGVPLIQCSNSAA